MQSIRALRTVVCVPGIVSGGTGAVPDGGRFTRDNVFLRALGPTDVRGRYRSVQHRRRGRDRAAAFPPRPQTVRG